MGIRDRRSPRRGEDDNGERDREGSAPRNEGPKGSRRRGDGEGNHGQGVADADVHVRGACREEIGAAERGRKTGARGEKTAKARPPGGENARCDEGREDKKDGCRRELDSEGDREIERVALAGDLAEEVVEAFAGAGDALYEKQPRAVGRDRLRERSRQRDGGMLLRQPGELMCESCPESSVARARECEKLNEKKSGKGGD